MTQTATMRMKSAPTDERARWIALVVLCAGMLMIIALIFARFVQGVGGTLTSAVILGMVVTMFPEPGEQAKAIGVYSFVASAGASIGLLLGGVVTSRSTGTGSSSTSGSAS